jgi:hypothetical protein
MFSFLTRQALYYNKLTNTNIMPVYRFSPQGNIDMKKTWTRTMWVYYAVIIVVFAYNLLYKGHNALSIGIFVVIITALGFGFIFGRKKYFAIIDTTELSADDASVTLHVKDRPDITLAYRNIKKIIQRKDGIQLISKLPAEPSMIIINKFEDFGGIEVLITNKINSNELPADKQGAVVR